MEQHTYKAFAIPGLLYCTCLQNMGKSHVLHKLTTFLFCLHYMPLPEKDSYATLFLLKERPQTTRDFFMSKKLIAYFSAQGTTAAVAKKLAEACGGDLYEIKPQVPYSRADLNWNDKTSRTSVEMRDTSFRPAIADNNAHVEDYDVIFLGFPIWWYIAPTIINTFLEAYDFSGKTIVLFATSGGSGFGKTVRGIKGSVAPSCTTIQGKLLNAPHSTASLKAWVESLNV